MKNLNLFTAMIFLLGSSGSVWGSDSMGGEKENPDSGKKMLLSHFGSPTSDIWQANHPEHQEWVDSLTAENVQKIYDFIPYLTNLLQTKLVSEQIKIVPQELWNHLFSFLPDPVDLQRLSGVSKLLYSVTLKFWQDTPLVLSYSILGDDLFKFLKAKRNGRVLYPHINLKDMKSLKHFIEEGEDAQYVELLETDASIDDASEFETLPKFTALEKLCLWDEINFTNDHLYLLSRLTNLIELDLRIGLPNQTINLRDSENSNYTSLFTLTKLCYLYLASEGEDNRFIGKRSIGDIARLTSLTDLNLDNCIEDPQAILPLTNLMNLETLDLSYCAISGSLASLSNLSNLQSLKLLGNEICEGDIQDLGLITSLTLLDFTDCNEEANIPPEETLIQFQGENITWDAFLKKSLPRATIVW